MCACVVCCQVGALGADGAAHGAWAGAAKGEYFDFDLASSAVAVAAAAAVLCKLNVLSIAVIRDVAHVCVCVCVCVCHRGSVGAQTHPDDGGSLFTGMWHEDTRCKGLVVRLVYLSVVCLFVCRFICRCLSFLSSLTCFCLLIYVLRCVRRVRAA